MTSITDFMAFAAEWGPSGVVGMMFGWMTLLFWRDRKQGSGGAQGPSAHELVERVMKAAEVSSDTKEIREDIEALTEAVQEVRDAQIRLMAVMESRK